jgi:hypothetical protein
MVAPNGDVRLSKFSDGGMGKTTRVDLGIRMSPTECDAICNGPLAYEFDDRVDDDWRMNGKRFRKLVDEFMARPDLRSRRGRKAL